MWTTTCTSDYRVAPRLVNCSANFLQSSSLAPRVFVQGLTDRLSTVTFLPADTPIIRLYTLTPESQYNSITKNNIELLLRGQNLLIIPNLLFPPLLLLPFLPPSLVESDSSSTIGEPRHPPPLPSPEAGRIPRIELILCE